MTAPMTIAAAVAEFLDEPNEAPQEIPRSWYVIATEPGAEARALLGIEAEGFPAYLPCEWHIVTHARRKIPRKYPLIPGYLFARFNAAREDWGRILAVRGVDYVLGAD